MSHLPDLTKRHYLLLFLLFNEAEKAYRLPDTKNLACELLTRGLVEVKTMADSEKRSLSIEHEPLVSISLSEKGRAHCHQLMSIPLPEESKAFRSLIHNWSWSSEDE